LAKVKSIELVSKKMQEALAVETTDGKTEYLYGITKKEWAHFQAQFELARRKPLVVKGFVEVDSTNQKEVAKQNKAADKTAASSIEDEKKVKKQQESAEFTKKYGEVSVAATFGGQRVTIYRKGFVTVGNIIGMFAGEPQELLEISGSTEITKKSGVGRAVGAVFTAGANLIASENQRGNIYLSIATSKTAHSLMSGSGSRWDIENMGKLVAAGKAAISARESMSGKSKKASKVDSASGSGIDKKLERLASLHKKGLLDDAEYKASKAKLLDL
jgi:hypothetical protein